MEERFTWIPLYKELSKALLKYKDDRRPLVEWIYDELGKVTRGSGKSLVSYLHLWGGSKIQDIDPFSVYGIFNRNLSWENRTALLDKFKEHFSLTSAVPTDFNGIPTLDPRRSYFFTWDDDNDKVIRDLWSLFEKVVMDEADLEDAFNRVIDNGIAKRSLTMALFWIAPDRFLSLDSRNRSYMVTLGLPDDYPDLHYQNYRKVLEQVQSLMQQGKVPCNSFQEFSYLAWKKANSSTDKTTKTMAEQNNVNEYIELLKESHNIVLTGAPGTGKTFLAKLIADQMQAECEMVQFHPSYDYTDFVEGLRPVKDSNGNVAFERQDGTFKKFCKRALLASATSTNSDAFEGLNDNPTVWKVSLAGTGDNPVRTDCLKNNHIRIGWASYGNVDDFNEFEAWEEDNPGKAILRTFQQGMNIGDIVVSCYSSKTTDAIGIVTGDYEYRAEGGDYPRYRAVRWIYQGKPLDITAINQNKTMTLSTVYRLSCSSQDIIELVNANISSTHHTEAPASKPFVFIIDEINRGEVSKIFGELFFSIDPGYRGEDGQVATQYQGMIDEDDVFKKGFYVPENVYVIGTMNDIDRSVESMDFALRRRFVWKEITPDDRVAMLDELPDDTQVKAKETMTRLNQAIADTDGLGAAYMIGPAYFLKLGENGGDFTKLWKTSIQPLLKEYLRGFRKAATILEKFEKAYFDEKNESPSQIADED